jgi:hypothetical protein
VDLEVLTLLTGKNRGTTKSGLISNDFWDFDLRVKPRSRLRKQLLTVKAVIRPEPASGRIKLAFEAVRR